MRAARLPGAAPLAGAARLAFLLAAALAFSSGERPARAQEQEQEAKPHHSHRHQQVEPPPAAPVPVTLTVGEGDTPLVMYTTLDGKTPSAAAGSVRLLVPGSATVVLRMLATDLQADADPGLRIDRGDVSIPSGVTLTGDLPHNLRITVSNIPRPGNYSGRLTFYVPGQTTPALELPLLLRARSRSDVAPVQTSVSQRVALCANRFSCWVAKNILPESAISDELQVHVENRTHDAAVLTSSSLLLRGEHSGTMVPLSVLVPQPALPRRLAPHEVTPISFALNRNQLAPDHYQGSLRLVVEGSDEPVSINLDLSVRHGPLLPMLILLLGVAMGRLVQKMDTPEIQRQMRMMDRLTELAERAEAVTHPAAHQLVQRHLGRLRTQIESGRESEEMLQMALDKVVALIELLVNIEELELLAAQRTGALRTEVQRAGTSARQLLTADRFSEAEEQRQRMEMLLAEGQLGQGGPSLPQFDGERRLEMLQSTAQAMADSSWRRVKALLRFVSGVSTNSANLRYWLVRPLMSVALLFLLSLLGLQQLYVGAGATFGASGLYDYLSLLVWGLSADVAQRSLHSLPGTGAK